MGSKIMLSRSIELEKVITGVAAGLIDEVTAKRKARGILYGIIDKNDDDMDALIDDVFDRVCIACGYHPIEVETGPGNRQLTDVRRIFALVIKNIVPDIGPKPIAKKLRRDRTATYQLWESGYNLLETDADFRERYDTIFQTVTSARDDQG